MLVHKSATTYNGHFLAGSLAEGLGPLDLAGVALHFEVLVAF
jgi:hypothetical protein